MAKGMLGLAQKIIVTEDSLAMISEAVASGKPVIVLRVASNRLPEKHQRFLNQLVEKKWVSVANLQNLGQVMESESVTSSGNAIEEEKILLIEALQKLL